MSIKSDNITMDQGGPPKEGISMALLTAQCGRTIAIRKDKADQFFKDSKKHAPTREKIEYYKKCAQLIPFKGDDK